MHTATHARPFTPQEIPQQYLSRPGQDIPPLQFSPIKGPGPSWLECSPNGHIGRVHTRPNHHGLSLSQNQKETLITLCKQGILTGRIPLDRLRLVCPGTSDTLLAEICKGVMGKIRQVQAAKVEATRKAARKAEIEAARKVEIETAKKARIEATERLETQIPEEVDFKAVREAAKEAIRKATRRLEEKAVEKANTNIKTRIRNPPLREEKMVKHTLPTGMEILLGETNIVEIYDWNREEGVRGDLLLSTKNKK